MVRLRNIKRNETTIEADFYPEDCPQAGHIVVDLKTHEYIRRVYPPGYEGYFMYTTHARRALLELADKETLPEEYTVMWY